MGSLGEFLTEGTVSGGARPSRSLAYVKSTLRGSEVPQRWALRALGFWLWGGGEETWALPPPRACIASCMRSGATAGELHKRCGSLYSTGARVLRARQQFFLCRAPSGGTVPEVAW